MEDRRTQPVRIDSEEMRDFLAAGEAGDPYRERLRSRDTLRFKERLRQILWSFLRHRWSGREGLPAAATCGPARTGSGSRSR